MGLATVSETVANNNTSNQVNRGVEKNESFRKLQLENRRERCVSKIQIVWCFVSFLISVADVLVILYLSYLHFRHSADLVAWLMLTPILLNFIGMFTFLSNDAERREMESLASKRYKNYMFFPVVGPAFSAIRLFAYTLQEPNAERTERLESLLTRMKQYESFFRAAPEAFVQITFRIITWSANKELHAEDRWTSLCIALCLFTLAESNMYAPVMPYYQMFHYEQKEDAWKVGHIGLPWRVGLFFFCYLSIGSRIFADAILKATACFLFENQSFGEVIIISFITQFFFRAALYALVNSLASKHSKLKVTDEGVYGAFTYAWKSLFMSFDFASDTKAIFFWFYMETFCMIVNSYLIIYVIDVDLSERYIFHFYSITAVCMMVLAIALKIWLRYRWKKRHGTIGSGNKVSDRL